MPKCRTFTAELSYRQGCQQYEAKIMGCQPDMLRAEADLSALDGFCYILHSI